jgi:transposase
MTQDDVLFGYRLQLFALAAERGVSEACRLMGVHRSTYYRWKHEVQRSGLEMLRPRERRRPVMPNQLSVLVEQRIVTFSLGHPGLGPRRILSRLARPQWGGLVVSPNGVYKALVRHGLNTRAKRLALVAGYRAPFEPPRERPAETHLETTRPGELVGIDCFLLKLRLGRVGHHRPERAQHGPNVGAGASDRRRAPGGLGGNARTRAASIPRGWCDGGVRRARWSADDRSGSGCAGCPQAAGRRTRDARTRLAASNATSPTTSTTTTTTANITAGSQPDDVRPISSTVPARWSPSEMPLRRRHRHRRVLRRARRGAARRSDRRAGARAGASAGCDADRHWGTWTTS